MIAQWEKSKRPVGPYNRVMITMADVALEFAAIDPSLFGIEGRAEPVIKALAINLADLIPDDTNDLGPKNILGDQLAGIFLRAALKALSSCLVPQCSGTLDRHIWRDEQWVRFYTAAPARLRQPVARYSGVKRA